MEQLWSRDLSVGQGCPEGLWGKCPLTHTLQDSVLQELEPITGSLLPRLQQIGKETFLVSIHTVLGLISEHCGFWADLQSFHIIRIGSALSSVLI